jgi:hypothetical protein
MAKGIRLHWTETISFGIERFVQFICFFQGCESSWLSGGKERDLYSRDGKRH